MNMQRNETGKGAKRNMQRNETGKGAKRNMPIKGCILMVTGTLKKRMLNKKVIPKA